MRDKRLIIVERSYFKLIISLKKHEDKTHPSTQNIIIMLKNSGKIIFNQPCLEFISRYSSEGRRLGTEKILPTSLIGDATSEIAKGNWERS